MKKVTQFKGYLLGLFSAICTMQAGAQTQYIHMGTATDLLNGITVTWNGSGTADSIKWGYTSTYEKGKFLAAKRAAVTLSGNWFSYNFGNSITPAATIYYTIKDSKKNTWSAQHKYHTVPAIPSDPTTINFSFAAAGDSRDGASEFTTIANSINAKQPNFVVFNGDLTASGNVASEWTTWFNSIDTLGFNKIMFHCEGNHDAAAPTTYLNMFDLPTNGDGSDYNFYSYTYGNTLFIVLNFEYGDVAPANSADWTAQTTWLTNLLKSVDTNTIKWKVVSWHEPYYTCGQHIGEMTYPGWWPVFDQYGVDLVLNGHDHSYQRFKPINQSVSTTAPVKAYGSYAGEGRCEIVCGGAGAPLYTETTGSSDPNLAFLQTFQSTNNFVICNETGCKSGVTKMHITAYNDAGTTILDSLTLTKPCTTNPTAVSEITPAANSMKVVPNPVSTRFTLQYNTAITGDAVIKICDIQGKEIKTVNVKKSEAYMEYQYDVSGMAKGTYLISVTIGPQHDTTRFIVQ
jgi:hypothetical protein